MLDVWIRTGNLAARHVRLENPAQPVKYQGVVSTIKDSYGFIERADVVDEIFFHFSEAKNIPGGLKLGDDVEFFIQTRNVSKRCIFFCIGSKTYFYSLEIYYYRVNYQGWCQEYQCNVAYYKSQCILLYV